MSDQSSEATKSSMTNRNSRMDVTTIMVTPGFGTGKQTEVRYLNPKVIGSGSFGVVYMATLYDSKEKVAIKKVRQDKRFKNRELQIMKRLDHPNIVKLLYHYYTVDGDDYLNLILEFMPKTLFQLNKASHPITDYYIRLYSFQLFRGLAFMHMHHICHRDIKPQNLLVDPEYGVLKICDFGSAKVINTSDPSVAYICSRYYRAPELVYGATVYTTSIDTWSAGTVLAELYLHTPIFRGETAATQITAIMKVLGVPCQDDMKAMNPALKDKDYPKIKPVAQTKMFFRTPSQAIDLIFMLLRYNPTERETAIEAMAHPFFDPLRKTGNQLMPNGNLAPCIFDWYEKEFNIRPDLNRKIHPKVAKAEEADEIKNSPVPQKKEIK